MPSIRNAGIPQLRGPYLVDFSDITHDGDTKVLFTPTIGDVLLAFGSHAGGALAVWQQNGLDINNGGLDYGTVADPTMWFTCNMFTPRFDRFAGWTPWVFASTSPIQVRYNAQGDGSLTAGRTGFYALIARSLAP